MGLASIQSSLSLTAFARLRDELASQIEYLDSAFVPCVSGTISPHLTDCVTGRYTSVKLVYAY